MLDDSFRWPLLCLSDSRGDNLTLKSLTTNTAENVFPGHEEGGEMERILIEIYRCVNDSFKLFIFMKKIDPREISSFIGKFKFALRNVSFRYIDLIMFNAFIKMILTLRLKNIFIVMD